MSAATIPMVSNAIDGRRFASGDHLGAVASTVIAIAVIGGFWRSRIGGYVEWMCPSSHGVILS
jgi:hypothetical protein